LPDGSTSTKKATPALGLSVTRASRVTVVRRGCSAGGGGGGAAELNEAAGSGVWVRRQDSLPE